MTGPGGREVARVSVRVAPDTSKFAAALRTDLRKLESSLKVSIPTELDTRGLAAHAKAAALAAEQVAGTVSIRTEVDRASFAKAGNVLDSFSGRLSLLAGTVAALGPALVPVIAVLSAAVAGLAVPVAAAAAGLGGFAAFALPAFTAVAEASEKMAAAQEKVNNALTSKARETALARQRQLLASLDPAIRSAVLSLNKLKETYKTLSKSLQPQIFGVFNAGLKVATNALPLLASLAKAIAPALTTLANRLAAAFASPAAKKFVTFLAAEASPAILAFGKILGNLAVGFARLLEAFAPIGRSILDGLVQLSAGFAGMATSKGFQQFLDYAVANGPIVAGTLREIGRAVLNALKVIAPLGVEVLKVVRPLAGFIADALGKVPGYVRSFGAEIRTLDLSGVATAFKEKAAAWAQSIIDGIKTGLNTGDWNDLGRTVGEGLSKIVVAGGHLAATITKWFAGLDWYNIGREVGRQAASFGVGVSATLFEGIWKAIKEHPFDATLAIASIIPIGRLAGGLSKVFSKIPMGGPAAGLLNAISDLGRILEKPVFAVGGFIGRNIWAGFTKHFPDLAGRFRGAIDTLVTTIYAKSVDMTRAGLRLAAGLAEGVGSGIGGAVAAVLRLIGRLLAPFVNAGVWLVQRGVGVVLGLVRGIVSAGGYVASAAMRVVQTLLRPFAPAASWLVVYGIRAIAGFVGGIGRALGAVASVAGSIRSRVVGALSSVGSWLVDAGRQMITGLVRGISGAIGSAASAAAKVAQAAVNAAKKVLHVGSPSRVFEWIGRMSGQGLVAGFDAMAGQVGAASVRMVNAAVLAGLADPALASAGVGGTTNNSFNFRQTDLTPASLAHAQHVAQVSARVGRPR